jgi:epoxyqueuosine reductase
VDLADAIRRRAYELGFARVAFTSAAPLRGGARLAAWLAAGRHGEMAYLATPSRDDPAALLASARAIVTCAMSYASPEPPAAPGEGPRGRIARYARGRDYHHVLKSALKKLAEFVVVKAGCDLAWRSCVDTAPLLEREAAARAGLGFVAKNTMLISPGLGSYTLLGELLLPVDLPQGEAETPRCGRCTACIDRCPTGALTPLGEHAMDARRCISYLTIELDGPIPRELRPLVGDWVFGCDLCQEVCPFNSHPSELVPADLRPRASHARPPLRALLGMGAYQFRKYVAGSSLRRVRRRQLLRNVCVALGNVGGAGDVPALAAALADRDALVRGHAAWALGRLPGGRYVLAAAAPDQDAWVSEEIALALAVAP